MATQTTLPPQQVQGQPAGWTHAHLFQIRDDVLAHMDITRGVLTMPLDITMPRGVQAESELSDALGDIFTVMIDPIADTMTFVCDVGGIKKRKSARVGRPKNCFVIYRLDKHEAIKALNPGMSNNDLSKVIATEWRHESKEVKDEYHRRAEEEKRQHAIDHPGYQYQPRKPSEKKKRMTKNKLAKLASTSNSAMQVNTQIPQQQQRLPRPAPVSPSSPALNDAASWSVSGLQTVLPLYNDPVNHEQANRTTPFVEQSRQDELEMSHWFHFEDASGPIADNFAPGTEWFSDTILQ